MIRSFWRDRRGNFAIMMSLAIVPIIGSVALGVDYAEMSRQRVEMLNSLDAAAFATARRITEGANDNTARSYAEDFFESNLRSIPVERTTLTVTLPSSNAGGGSLQLCGTLDYQAYFLPAFRTLIGVPNEALGFTACSEVRLKNTLEVALVLDNSGSMAEKGKGSGKTRLQLLKDAATQLVDTIAAQGEFLRQIDEPVKFGIVPFAAAVNVGPAFETASWMDNQGISPIHHENFDWVPSFPETSNEQCNASGRKCVQRLAGMWIARGDGWDGDIRNKPLNRFVLYKSLRNSRGNPLSNAVWAGCVEARPYPFNVNDAEPSAYSDGVSRIFGNPATLFVPMFAPDEPDDMRVYSNSWWSDRSETWPQGRAATPRNRQRDVSKYFYNQSRLDATGPNMSCTTTPITPLTDVTNASGKEAVKDAIRGMQADGNTNVPEALAWGWRVLSSTAPFTEGRPERERGNDKVVILLTDGANTYGDLNDRDDIVGNRSTYAAYGYVGQPYSDTGITRLFSGISINRNTFTGGNYTTALNRQFETLCENLRTAKTNDRNNVIVMTVALDLNEKNSTERSQIEALKACASDSRYTTGKRLFWNTTGKDLGDVFDDIADELSNLRLVS